MGPLSRRIALLVAFVGVIAASIIIYFGTGRESGYFRVAIATWPGFGLGNVAKELGFFKDVNVDFSKIDDPTARIAAFRAGRVNIMISSLDVFAQEASTGLKGRVFLVTDNSYGADGIVVRTDVSSLKDLYGRKVAVAQATPSHFFLRELFRQKGYDLSKIELVFFQDPTLAGQAFVAGKVDAAVTWEPLMSEIVQRPGNKILYTTKDTPDTIVDVLVADERLLRSSDKLRAFADGWLRAVEFAKRDPAKARPIIAAAIGAPADQSDSILEGVDLADRAKNRKMLCAKPAPAADLIESAQSFWVSIGVIKEMQPAASQLVADIVCANP